MIKIIKNILTNKERKQLIEYSKPLLLTGEELNRHAVQEGLRQVKFPPSKQTLSDLHRNDKFIPIIIKILKRIESETKLKVIVDNVWVNYNKGKKEEEAWHSHSYEYAVVYYIKTIPFLNNGTRFENKFVRAPQNSLIMFPGYLRHSVPSYPFYFERYTLAIDLNIRR